MDDAVLELESLSMDGHFAEPAVVEPTNGNVSGNEVRFVSFLIGDEAFLIPATLVSEVINPLPVTPLPNSPEILAGISALRGEILAVLDLKNSIGTGQLLASPKPKFIVLASDGQSIPVVVPVDRMSELVSFDPDNFSADPNNREHVLARTSRGGEFYYYLDTGGMIDRLTQALV